MLIKKPASQILAGWSWGFRVSSVSLRRPALRSVHRDVLLGDFATTAVERVRVYSALSLPCGGIVLRLLASRTYGGIPRGFLPLGQDIEALVPVEGAPMCFA